MAQEPSRSTAGQSAGRFLFRGDPSRAAVHPDQSEFFDSDAREFLSHWETQHANSALPVSQADFFAPAELFTTNDVSTSRETHIDEDDIPLHPSAPRIVISEPGAPLLLEKKPTLKKTTLLDETQPPLLGPRLPQRRHSTISIVPERNTSEKVHPQAKDAPLRPTPRPWTTTEMYPRNGWKMKVRYAAGDTTVASVDVIVVYMFNSATCNQLDRDADLAMFKHHHRPVSHWRGTSPMRIFQRARTDLGKQSSRDNTDVFSAKQHGVAHSQADSQTPQRQHVNWLTDVDMLRKQIPGMRLVTIGYDMKPTGASYLNFEIAARQLHDYLQQHRTERATVPMVFLGHTLGGLFIIKALSEQAPSNAMLSDTAGIFLFSNYTSFTPARIQLFASLYGSKATDNMFNELHKSSEPEKTVKAARNRLFFQHPYIGMANMSQERQNRFTGVSIGFPIFQILARGEGEDSSDAGTSLSSLLSTPVRTITVDKEPSNVLKFPNPQDPDFLHLVMLIQSALQTHKLLHAAASGRVDDIHSLIRRKTNVNFRDRWSQTALQIAVRMNHEEVVNKLLSAKNVDPNVRDRLANTPLHYAVRVGNEDIVRALIYNGADIGLENQRKRTAKDLAEKHRSRKHIAKLLKSKLMSGPDQSPSSKLVGTGKPPTTRDGILACKNSQITVTEIYAIRNSDKHWSVNVSVEALLYGSNTLDYILDQVRPQAVKDHDPVCVWIHIPENNMVWIEDLFSKLRFHPAIWKDTRRSVTESLRNRAITPHFNGGNIRSLFLPYISYEDNVRQAKRTAYIQAFDAAFQQRKSTGLPFENSALAVFTARSSQLSTAERKLHLQVPERKNLEGYPYHEEDSDSDFSDILEPEDPDALEEEEKSMINEYLYSPPALHVRRTLDQYYYHMLENTHERDIDQVVSRWAQDVRSENRHNILMVDQLWLWMGQNHETIAPGEAEMEELRRRDRSSDRARRSKTHRYIVSCFPNRTGSGQSSHRTLDDLRLRVLDPNSRKRDPICQPEDLVSRILETCCNAFDRMQDVEMLRFFQMFEDSVGTIDDKESRLFRDFQRGSNKLLELDHANKYYNKKKNALLTDLLDIREEIKLLVEVKDIRDEVNIILAVLNIQRTLVDQMTESKVEDVMLRVPVVRNIILADVNDFTKLDNQARTIQEKLNTLMDLKQKAANAWEAKEARETAVATGKQGNTVLVFTVVTIIFLPLSFMSSFFAIGIAAFPHNAESGEVDWPLGTIMGLLFGVSLSVSIPLIIFALNMDYFTSIFKELRYNYLTNLGIRLIPLFPPIGPSKESTAYRRRWTGLLQKHREDYMKNDDLVVPKLGSSQDHSLDIKPGASFPSTISSQKVVGEDEDIPSSRANKNRRRFRSQRKFVDDESLVGI